MSFNIMGTGSAYPKKVLTNDDLSKIVDTNDEWISTRTGIKERHVCSDETINNLAVMAANYAIKDAGILPSDIDLIICATLGGDYITPSTGCVIQKEIGAVCPAFDINAACSGFIYALDVADSYFISGKVNKVLVVVADSISKFINWEDRATCVLFGDAAAAVVLEKGDGLKSIMLSAHGNEEVLNLPNVSGVSPWNTLEKKESYLSMNGQEVYKFAVTSMIHDVNEVMTKAGITPDKVDFVLPHQANLRIIDKAKQKLEIPEDRYYTNIERFGNTSAVGIPLLLDELNKQGKFKKGNIIAMSAFGGGLTTGACIIEWNN